jgi:hypothetical protein
MRRQFPSQFVSNLEEFGVGEFVITVGLLTELYVQVFAVAKLKPKDVGLGIVFVPRIAWIALGVAVR